MPKEILFTLDSGDGDFGVVPVGTVSAAKAATLRNDSRYRIDAYALRTNKQFKARVSGVGSYAKELGAFTLGEYFTPGTLIYLSTGSRNLGTDPFETGVLLGVANAEGGLAVDRHDYLIDDSGGWIENDDDANPIEADR